MTHTIPNRTGITRERGQPLLCYQRWRDELGDGEALLLVDFQFECYWLDPVEVLALTAIYYVNGARLKIAVTDQILAGEGLPPRAQYLRWVDEFGLVSVDPSAPVGLHPEYIAKPWGREIWYTGVERRGVCTFTSGDARTPIPWLQAVIPGFAAGAAGEALVLLKILDPLPHPVLGDLYFELHESKREVYVVTHIDERAWPDGVGYIRCGFDPKRIGQYPGQDAFRAAYLESVLAYESLRRELDGLLERGGAPDPAQHAREKLLREQMDGFTLLHPVRVGDVFQVPRLLPHALQHGVRVIEFQTPSYERKIVSYAQKVLTQDRWDSREAVAQMRLAAPVAAAPRPVFSSTGLAVEQIVEFPDFEVQRVTLQAGRQWQVEAGASYALLMVVAGTLELAASRYGPEQAVLLPRLWRGLVHASGHSVPLVLLLARPRVPQLRVVEGSG
jgi:hypothetical protein